MASVCDACRRDKCRVRMDGLRTCDMRVAESNYEKLFGTPERAARVVVALNNCRVTDCADCWARGACRYFGEGDDYESLLEWLESEACDD